MSKIGFLDRYSVSRETIERLELYERLLRKWNPRINLVANSTLKDIWSRHFADSAALTNIQGQSSHWVDLGSGGGFPGLVIAIMLAETKTRISLVESDTRKSAFLRQVVRETGIKATIIADRIENLSSLQATVISARALAPLSLLLEHMRHHAADGAIGLFPKGTQWQQDLNEALCYWKFSHTIYPSGTDSDGVVLRIEDLSRA
jgi:16S rRNA (guanine527-N7)-methyltransferase